jgi:hypothetical protein
MLLAFAPLALTLFTLMLLALFGRLLRVLWLLRVVLRIRWLAATGLARLVSHS